MRDARERLVAKNKPVDAREKLNQKAQSTDARQKLMTIRSQKEPQDARAKIQAKKQLQTGQSQTQDGNFTLTRTVRISKLRKISKGSYMYKGEKTATVKRQNLAELKLIESVF